MKFTDFGRCLVCLHNPCECNKKKQPDFRTDPNTGDQYCATCGEYLDEYGKCKCERHSKTA